MNEEMNYMEIGKKYRITWDNFQFILHQKRKIMDKETRKYTNEEKFVLIGYYPYIEGALKKILNLELKKSNSSKREAKEILEQINNTYDMIHNFCIKLNDNELREELIKIEKSK